MPRPPRQRFPRIRQFSFCLFHPKTRPSPSPLHLLRDGWQKHSTAYSFNSQFSTAGAGHGEPGSGRLLAPRMPGAAAFSGPKGWGCWSTVLFPACPTSPCHLPHGRLQRQPTLLVTGFTPVALLPSQPLLHDQWLCSCLESTQAPVDLDLQAAMDSGQPARAAQW